jgi:hypothetical protein
MTRKSPFRTSRKREIATLGLDAASPRTLAIEFHADQSGCGVGSVIEPHLRHTRLALFPLDPSGKPWIQQRPEDEEEEQRRTKSHKQPDQNRGVPAAAKPIIPSLQAIVRLAFGFREIEARKRDTARTIPMTATTSPAAAPRTAGVAVSPIFISASSAISHTPTATTPANSIAIPTARARLVSPESA